MSPFKILLPALAGLMLAGAAYAADAPAAPPRGAMAQPGCHAIFRDLTPEQRLIHFQDVKKKMDSLTVTQFRDWRTSECNKFAKLTAAERKSYVDGLDAKWKALSDSEKLTLYHDALSMRDKMGPGMGPGHMGRGHGFGPRDGQGLGPNHHRPLPRD